MQNVLMDLNLLFFIDMDRMMDKIKLYYFLEEEVFVKDRLWMKQLQLVNLKHHNGVVLLMVMKI